MADVRRGLWVPPPRRPPREERAQEPTDRRAELRPLCQRPDRRPQGRGQRGNDRSMTLGARATSSPTSATGRSRDRRPGGRCVPRVQGRGLRGPRAGDRARQADAKRVRPGCCGRSRRRRSTGRSTPCSGCSRSRSSTGASAENPAEGRRRRLRESQARPRVPGHGRADRGAAGGRRPSSTASPHCAHRARPATDLATLLFAGPRAGELCNLRWRDIDLANGRIFIGRSKTGRACARSTSCPSSATTSPPTRRAPTAATPTTSSSRPGPAAAATRTTCATASSPGHRARRRAARSAAACRCRSGLTPHKLRHTFASILIALGEDPASVMGQLGHTDPQFTLRVYTHMMRRGPAERQRLKALVRGEMSRSRAVHRGGGGAKTRG